jgi:glycogen operon protein
MNASLMRLALQAGIEPEYWDGLGMRRELGAHTAAALLGALGFDPGADPAAQCEALLDAAFLAPLAAAVVLRTGEAHSLELALPQSRRDESIAFELLLEDGGRLDGTFVASSLQQLAGREVAGREYARFRLPLPAGLPEGYHQFALPALGSRTTLIIGPAQCHLPPSLEQGGRCWGLAVQLYSLRSVRNWGMGDFGDLAVLAQSAGQAGAAFIGLNPLHARHLVAPDEASPYAPSSRRFLDPLYIDVAAVDGYAACAEVTAMLADAGFRARLAAAREARLVDYPAVTALKLPVLQLLYGWFRQAGPEAGARDFQQFRQAGGDGLARFAEFEALRLHLQRTTGQDGTWHEWPEAWRDPASPAIERFRSEAAEAIGFQAWLQWVASAQLRKAAQAGATAGMAIGLYRDLAVGAARDSAETWSAQDLFAQDISVGAPPDMLNRQGQSWGLPPWNPQALARQGYAAFRDLLAANMQDAGALRIDHVMALMRLFWIPQGMSGADGGYVRNAFDALTTILALESQRHRCMVIGEDLGSVPEGLRPRLHELGLLSYRVMVYERHWQGDGRFCLPDEYPPQSLATVATHDMPTMNEFWTGGDIERRAQLGLYPGPDPQRQREEDAARRRAERDGMLRLLGECGLSPADPQDAGAVLASLHAAVARTRSMLAVVQMDDLIGESEPVNVPGTYREYPNWRRKLSLPLETILADPRWAGLAAAMREAGRA